jgi:hypothetical protein
MDNVNGQSWRKSTYSTGNGGDCVEVAPAARGMLIRDTKNRQGFVLSVPAEAWRKFIAAVPAMAGIQD